MMFSVVAGDEDGQTMLKPGNRCSFLNFTIGIFSKICSITRSAVNHFSSR